MAAAQEGGATPASTLMVDGLSYHPAGTPAPLLNNVSLQLPPGSLGVVFGRSGSGKTTLMACLSGLVQQTAGSIGFSGVATTYVEMVVFHSPTTVQTTTPAYNRSLTCQQRQAAMGLVFQFPERHFIGATLAQELTLGWPRGDPTDTYTRQMVAANVLQAVGLLQVPLDTPLHTLSDGYKRYAQMDVCFALCTLKQHYKCAAMCTNRRVALAVQLCRQPRLLLLDEPLAGLDWQSRAEVAQLLGMWRAHEGT